MRPDMIAEVILLMSRGKSISKNIEKALLEQHGAIPDKLTVPIPNIGFNLINKLLDHYHPRLSFSRKPLIAYFDVINKCMIWIPIFLTLASVSVAAGAFISGADFFWRTGLLALAFLFGFLMKLSLSQGLNLAYALIDNAKPGNLIFFILGPEQFVTTTTKTGKTRLFTGDDIDLKMYKLNELVIDRVLWKRVDVSSRIEAHLLVVMCCLYVFDHSQFSIQKDLILDRFWYSLSFLKMNHDDLVITYLEMLYYQEKGDLEQMKEKVDYIQTRESTYETLAYQAALEFLLKHPGDCTRVDMAN